MEGEHFLFLKLSGIAKVKKTQKLHTTDEFHKFTKTSKRKDRLLSNDVKFKTQISQLNSNFALATRLFFQIDLKRGKNPIATDNHYVDRTLARANYAISTDKC